MAFLPSGVTARFESNQTNPESKCAKERDKYKKEKRPIQRIALSNIAMPGLNVGQDCHPDPE